MGKLIFNINSAYAEFERGLIGDRAKDRVASKRAKILKNGVTTWGRKQLDHTMHSKIQELKQNSKSNRGIFKELKFSKTTVMKYLG